MNIHAQRLLNVARACRETLFPDHFDMSCYGHTCGTPGCALGNYVARRDLQQDFRMALVKSWMGDMQQFIFPVGTTDLRCRTAFDFESPAVLDHFGISEEEGTELFSSDGCGEAQTATQAASYIESFVARKWPDKPSSYWNDMALPVREMVT